MLHSSHDKSEVNYKVGYIKNTHSVLDYTTLKEINFSGNLGYPGMVT